MRLYRVGDQSFDEVKKTLYNHAIFASGYESRCIAVAKQLDPALVHKTTVLGFEALQFDKRRTAHDGYFLNDWKARPVVLGYERDDAVHGALAPLNALGTTPIRILVDYSSMSRLWYAGILNWVRYAASAAEVVVDFVYSVGRYEQPRGAMVINDVMCIPGCEGRGGARRDVAIFGLGFEGNAPLCVLDQLEPDVVYAFLASPGAFNNYPRRALNANADFLKGYVEKKAAIRVPLGSVERTFRHLGELIVENKEESNITLVPMGPKPHVLAAILLAMRFEEVSCLRVSNRRSRPEDVRPTGEFVTTRVEFKQEFSRREESSRAGFGGTPKRGPQASVRH